MLPKEQYGCVNAALLCLLVLSSARSLDSNRSLCRQILMQTLSTEIFRLLTGGWQPAADGTGTPAAPSGPSGGLIPRSR